MKKTLTALCIFFCGAFSLFSQSYSRLDEKIVDAYNTDPKKTQDIYIYSMQMLEKSRLDKSHSSEAWEDKAQKLVTVACFLEADRAMDNHDSREAYLWAMRGLSNGVSRGELGGVSMKQVYDYLKKLSERLAIQPEIKNMKYAETKEEILNYRKVRHSSDYLPRDKTGFDGRPEEKNKSYELLEGPAQDDSSNLYVKIKYDFGTVAVIRYYNEGGWRLMGFPEESGYYSNWQECADANAGKIKLKGLPSSPFKKHSGDKKKYYVPDNSAEKD